MKKHNKEYLENRLRHAREAIGHLVEKIQELLTSIERIKDKLG